MQTAKDQLEEFELVQQGKGGAGTTQYAARMEASKDIKERGIFFKLCKSICIIVNINTIFFTDIMYCSNDT